jgi:hypothetical protein
LQHIYQLHAENTERGHIYRKTLSQLVEYNDDGTCSLQYELANASDGVILGDTFLSSAYVVFDMDNSQAHLAQAHFNSTKENIHQITKRKDAVPKLKGEDCGDDNKDSRKERKCVAEGQVAQV